MSLGVTAVFLQQNNSSRFSLGPWPISSQVPDHLSSIRFGFHLLQWALSQSKGCYCEHLCHCCASVPSRQVSAVVTGFAGVSPLQGLSFFGYAFLLLHYLLILTGLVTSPILKCMPLRHLYLSTPHCQLTHPHFLLSFEDRLLKDISFKDAGAWGVVCAQDCTQMCTK